jgi:hypothetical protein
MALEHQVMVRLDSETFAQATKLAQSEDRPLSYFIRRAVKNEVERLERRGEFGGGVNRDAVRAMVRQKKEREVSPNFNNDGVAAAVIEALREGATERVLPHVQLQPIRGRTQEQREEDKRAEAEQIINAILGSPESTESSSGES